MDRFMDDLVSQYRQRWLTAFKDQVDGIEKLTEGEYKKLVSNIRSVALKEIGLWDDFTQFKNHAATETPENLTHMLNIMGADGQLCKQHLVPLKDTPQTLPLQPEPTEEYQPTIGSFTETYMYYATTYYHMPSDEFIAEMFQVTTGACYHPRRKLHDAGWTYRKNGKCGWFFEPPPEPEPEPEPTQEERIAAIVAAVLAQMEAS